MAAFKIIIHQIRGSPKKQVIQRFFCARFGAIAKSENDMHDIHKVFFFLFLSKKLPQK
jgi:hypothetical protein